MNVDVFELLIQNKWVTHHELIVRHNIKYWPKQNFYELNTYDFHIPPNIISFSQSPKRFTNNLRCNSDDLPTGVQRSQNLLLRSTVFVSYRHFIIGLFLIFQLNFQITFFLVHFHSSPFSLCTCWVSVCIWLDLPTTIITEPLSVVCQDF